MGRGFVLVLFAAPKQTAFGSLVVDLPVAEEGLSLILFSLDFGNLLFIGKADFIRGEVFLAALLTIVLLEYVGRSSWAQLAVFLEI
jgi:hypothetical protein